MERQKRKVMETQRSIDMERQYFELKAILFGKAKEYSHGKEVENSDGYPKEYTDGMAKK